MNKKQIHTLLVIFAVLLAGIFLRQQQTQHGVVTEDYTGLDFSVDVSRAARVSIARGSKIEMTAVKESRGWVLPELWNAQAAPEKVESFLKSFSLLRGELRADDLQLLSDFAINDERAMSVQVADSAGALLADLKVGAKSAGESAIFIRRAGSSAVYFADSDLFRQLGIYAAEWTEPLQPRLWADLEPVKIKQADMRAFQVSRYDGATVLNAARLKKAPDEKGAWGFETTYKHFKVDAAQVETYLRALASLRAATVVDPAGSYGFDHPVLQIHIEAADKSVILTVGKESADQRSRYLRVEGEAAIYEIAKFSYEDLAADDSRFFAAGLPGLNLGAVEKVTLVKQGQTQVLTTADKELFESVQQTLRGLSFGGLLLSVEEQKKVRSPGVESVTVTFTTGESLVLDIGERLEGAAAQGNRFAAQIRGDAVLFSIAEADYDALFEVFKPAETNASQPAPNKAQ